MPVHNSHLFGPVFSRRLGRSLGVDLLPCKTCSLDCVYCECGPTDRLTLERREWVPTGEVQAELEEFLAQDPALDFVTLGGCGEPTLHAGLDRIVNWLKRAFPRYRVAVLTNSTLLTLQEVREALLPADLVVPSLDAATGTAFARLNRPHPQVDLSSVVRGLESFARGHRGQVWLETVIVPGYNDGVEELHALYQVMQRLEPHRIQVGTLDRPPAVPGVRPASRQEMEKAARRLGSVEVLCR